MNARCKASIFLSNVAFSKDFFIINSIMKIYFIGIGGIGVSALARHYRSENHEVLGSDQSKSSITEDLEKEGIKINYSQIASNITKDLDLVVYSAAVRDFNEELTQVKKLNLKILSYAEALGELTRQYETVAVAGSHGKSTTTALLALILIKAGLDPTIIVGTKLKELGGSNYRHGKSRLLLIEADEWNRSFHAHHPLYTAITNVDAEHLDTFHNLAGVIEGFKTYFKNISPKGRIFINYQDQNSKKAAKNFKTLVSYYNDKKNFWHLKIKGEYNRVNAEAAWQIARFLGVRKSVAREAMGEYEGAWRRQERVTPKNPEQFKNIKAFFSDYAHHPTEIQATASALKELYPSNPLVIIFEPHQVERLNNLFTAFTQSFDAFKKILILPAYKVLGRESIGNLTSEDLVKALKKKGLDAEYLKNFDESLKLISTTDLKDPVVLFVGAGTIDNAMREHFDSLLLK